MTVRPFSNVSALVPYHRRQFSVGSGLGSSDSALIAATILGAIGGPERGGKRTAGQVVHPGFNTVLKQPAASLHSAEQNPNSRKEGGRRNIQSRPFARSVAVYFFM